MGRKRASRGNVKQRAVRPLFWPTAPRHGIRLAPRFWLGGLIAFLLFLPNLLWNIHYGFPFLELQRNIAHSSKFASVEKAARVEHPYSMPYEHFDVFYCRGLKQPLDELWPKLKSWD